MATRKAVANGNFSAPGTWSGGAVPGSGDTVYANGYTIAVDTHVLIGAAANPLVAAGAFVIGSYYEVVSLGTTAWNTVGGTGVVGSIFLATAVGSGTGVARALGTLTTLPNANAAVAAVQGGGFTLAAAWAVECDLRAGSTTCLSVSGAVGLSLTGVRLIGGTGTGVANARALDFGSTGQLSLTGCEVRSQGASGSFGVRNFGGGSVLIQSCALSGANNVQGISNEAGSVEVTASTSSGGLGNGNAPATMTVSNTALTGGNSSAHGLWNATGTVVLANCVCSASTTANNTVGVLNNSTGSVTATNCDWVASAVAYAFQGGSSAANVQLSGRFYDHWSGMPAVYAAKWRLGVAQAQSVHRMALNGMENSYLDYLTADNQVFGQPAASDVRSGVAYAGGAITGTLAVPLASQVLLGIAVDASVGTASLTAETIRDAVAEALNEAGLDAVLISRLGNVATEGLVAAIVQQAHES